jgi:CMP-N-acetylneuraminic acid synthetase
VLTFLLLLLSASNPVVAKDSACCDTLVLDSLGREIGDGSTVTLSDVRRLRHAALRIADTSTCAVARDRAEEMAFDMETIVVSLERHR